MPGMYAILLIMHGVISLLHTQLQDGVMSLLHTQLQDVLTITDYEASIDVRTEVVLTPPWTASHTASKFEVDQLLLQYYCYKNYYGD